MSLPSRLGILALVAASLGGCQSIGGLMGGGAGVMPESEVGPPPSMQGTLRGRQQSSAVDEDGRALPVAPTRQLALPKTMPGQARTASAGERRIDREDIEGSDAGRRGGGGAGLGPTMNNGNVGLGGRF